MSVAISAGHGKLIRGASGPEPWGLDEVDEARKVVSKVASYIGRDVVTYADDVSTTQNENLNRIVDWHNKQTRDIDISVHFNAYNVTDKPMGTECLYLSQDKLAKAVSDSVAKAGGLINRGPKKRSDLFFLNKTDKPAILIEVAFCDSRSDADLYRTNFGAICEAIAHSVAGVASDEVPTGLDVLMKIGPVTIYEKDDGKYVKFVSDLDICNDGSGPSHGDSSYQPQTAYYNNGKFLNADEDKYIVIPPQVRMGVPPVVLGCQGRVTNLIDGVWHDGVVGEIGPPDKTGEAAYSLAKIINPSISYNSGDKGLNYLYEIWPGKPAVVDGKTYKLEAAG